MFDNYNMLKKNVNPFVVSTDGFNGFTCIERYDDLCRMMKNSGKQPEQRLSQKVSSFKNIPKRLYKKFIPNEKFGLKTSISFSLIDHDCPSEQGSAHLIFFLIGWVAFSKNQFGSVAFSKKVDLIGFSEPIRSNCADPFIRV